MKRILTINVGDEFGDLKCIQVNPPIRSGKSTTYTMECKICHRRKKMLSSTIRMGHGITHKACGKGLKTLDPVFYDRWQAMRTRTNNPNYQHYEDYGGRGISSDEFKYFIDFYDAMYPSFKKLADEIGANNVSLERIDCNGDYTVNNCTWIPVKLQQSNTRKSTKIVYINKNTNTINTRKCLSAFSNQNNINYSSIHHYLYTKGVYVNNDYIVYELKEPIDLVRYSTDKIDLVRYSKV